ncbi:DUF2599 domain-containing protein [Pseudomonas wadenswilerensis]
MRLPAKRLVILIPPLLLPWALAQAETCEATLPFIQQMYNKTVDVCSSGELAADCAGLMYRGTKRADPTKNEAFDVWTSSPASVKQGAFAASYLRKDIGFDNSPMNTTNGFFITPREYLCPNQSGLYLQCAFVVDGWSWFRGDRGCGDNTNTAQVERYCQDSGITTGAAWNAQFNANRPATGAWSQVPHEKQCAFDLAQARGKDGRANAFKTFLEARRQAPSRENAMWNEIRLNNPNPPGSMPVLAFFAVNPAGKAEALANQRDYYAKTGQYRPVIDVVTPKSPGDVAQFSCSSGQMRPPATGSSPGFCNAGKPSSPGFGSTPIGNPAQQATQATQTAQAAAQAAQAAQAAAQATQAMQAAQAAGSKPMVGSYSLSELSAQTAQAAQAAQVAQAAATQATQAAQAAQAAAQSGQPAQAAQAAQAAQLAQGQAAAAAAAAQAAQATAGQCKQYIQSSTWIQRNDPVKGMSWSLSIVPTECGRKIGPDQTEQMYAELYNKHGKDAQWADYAKNYGSMRRQLVCHLVISREKPEWNLEPWRMYVDQASSVSQGCNSPPSK